MTVSNTGLVSGTPTQYGTYSVIFDVLNGMGELQQVLILNFSVTAWPVYTVSPNVTSNILVEADFDGGAAQPAGKYQIQYVTGSLTYQSPASVTWAVNYVAASRGYNYIAYGQLGPFPTPVYGAYATQAAAAAANTGANLTFTTAAPFKIGVQWFDGIGTPGLAGNPNPTFTLTRLE